MDATQARDDLEFVRGIVGRTSERIDAHAYHCVHWGAIVLVWYPLANWFWQRDRMEWYVGVGIAAVVLGAVLSAVRGARTSRHPRLDGADTLVSRQIVAIVMSNLAAGAVLSAVAPATHFIDGPNVPIVWGLVYANMAFMIGVAYSRDFLVSGVVIFLGCVLAMVFQRYNGYLLGPFMGIGMIVPGLRAEARVRRLQREDA